MVTEVATKPLIISKLELTRWELLERLLKTRSFQFWLILPNLFFFVLVILTGIFGTPVGNQNFSIIFVWIVWWALVIVVLIPFGARAWCATCPIPAPGEWLQRRAVIARNPGKPLGLGHRWPAKLRNIWMQNASFLAVATFSAFILTRPSITGYLLLGFILLAVALSLVFERRVFCRYVCPVGGFVGLFSMFAPVELRAKDPDVCRNHRTKECYVGGEKGYGCPWFEYVGNLERNAYCGLCTECLKACPQNNVAINLRPFAQDLFVAKQRGLDEAYKSLIMLACAGIYSIVFLGPWGWLKQWANNWEMPSFLGYATLFVMANLALVPGIFLAFTWLAKLTSGSREVKLGKLFINYSYALVPLGLIGWVAFSLSLVLTNVSYAIPLLSDPFGWGWNLLGTRNYPWTPYLSGLTPYLQVPLLLLGLAVSIFTAYRIARRLFDREEAAMRSLLPISIFMTMVTLFFLKLFVG